MSEETNKLPTPLSMRSDFKPVIDWIRVRFRQIEESENPNDLSVMLLELDVIARRLTEATEYIQSKIPDKTLEALYGVMIEMPVLYSCYGGAKMVSEKANNCGLGKFHPLKPSTKKSNFEKQMVTGKLVTRILLAKLNEAQSIEFLQEHFFPGLRPQILKRVIDIDLSASSTWDIAKLLTDIVVHSDIDDAPLDVVIALAIKQIDAQLEKRKSGQFNSLDKSYPRVDGERDALAETHCIVRGNEIEAMSHSRTDITNGITEFFHRQLNSHFSFSEKLHLPQK